MWRNAAGAIHFFFEGYFAYNHTRMVVAQDLFGQLWKEYSLADSRYLTSDPFVLCMETITAVRAMEDRIWNKGNADTVFEVAWGPLSFVTAFLIARKHSLRHPIQAIVSLGQIYGDVLYYATSLFDFYYTGVEYCRPEPYYFWFYYFFMNFLWIVIPGCTSQLLCLAGLPDPNAELLTGRSLPLPIGLRFQPCIQGLGQDVPEPSGQREPQEGAINVSKSQAATVIRFSCKTAQVWSRARRKSPMWMLKTWSRAIYCRINV